MTNTNITNLRKNIFDYANACLKYNDTININTKDGNIVMMSEAEYNGLMETLYLSSIPGVKESIIAGIKAPIEECEEFGWDD